MSLYFEREHLGGFRAEDSLLAYAYVRYAPLRSPLRRVGRQTSVRIETSTDRLAEDLGELMAVCMVTVSRSGR